MNGFDGIHDGASIESANLFVGGFSQIQGCAAVHEDITLNEGRFFLIRTLLFGRVSCFINGALIFGRVDCFIIATLICGSVDRIHCSRLICGVAGSFHFSRLICAVILRRFYNSDRSFLNCDLFRKHACREHNGYQHHDGENQAQYLILFHEKSPCHHVRAIVHQSGERPR